MIRPRLAPVLVAAVLLGACSNTPSPSAGSATPPNRTAASGVTATATPAGTPRPRPTATANGVPSPPPSASQGLLPLQGAGIYAGTASGQISPLLAGVPERVYVPDEGSGEVVVIDPKSFAIIGRFNVGSTPEHITPDWDLQRLYVNDMNSSALTVLDPRTGLPTRTISVPYPYNLYFSVDGRKAIIVEDFRRAGALSGNGLRFYDRVTWRLLAFVKIPFPGADHLDFSADGRYLLVSCEYSGVVVKIDTRSMKISGTVWVGGLPIDVRLAPAGDVFYVANQGSDGVSLVDPVAIKVIGFIPTGRGAHGLVLSRDATRMYVTNRIAGTISVISMAKRQVIATWVVGGTPDMMTVSPDGTQLWISNRYSGSVSVVDTRTGAVLHVIRTGVGPHGLTFWPQPGRFSLGHNGNMR